MTTTNRTWRFLLLLPTAVALLFFEAGKQIRNCPARIALGDLSDPSGKRRTTVEPTTANTPMLKMRWELVKENDRRQLRMRWSVPTNRQAGREVA
jgi:hypothetical protein